MRGILRGGSRMLLLCLVASIIVGVAASYAVFSASDSPRFQSAEGILDLTQVPVSENPQKLEGEWEFYWQELLMPEELQRRSASEEGDPHWLRIPNSWLGYQLEDQKLGGTGYATFRLVIMLSEQDRNESMALRLPAIFHAYKLWVNGELLSEVGAVGTDKSQVIPRLATKLVFFQPESDRVELVVQAANFHHKRGGITNSIELGGSDVLTVRTHLKLAAEMFVTASLLVIGVYHLLLYMLRRKDKAPLYFGVFTLLFGIRSLLVGEILITQVWPAIPWELLFKLEYLILCSSAYIIMRYFDCIFPHYLSLGYQLGIEIVTGVFCLIILIAPALIYSKLLSIIGVLIILHMIYLMVGLVRAAMQRMEGALFFLLVSMVVLVTVINDFLYYNEWSRVENTSPLGLLVFTLAQIFLLSSRFTRAASNEERITEELKAANIKLTEVNMNLEQIVQERTQALAAAHEDLRSSYDQLLHSEQGRKKLLAYITHDLRMPLSSMLGYVEAVQDKVKPERNEQYLKYIQDSTIRINRMIEELSFLSHLETGQVSFRMEPLDLSHFLRGFYEQYELIVSDAGLDFILDAGDAEDQQSGVPVVEMDVQRLEQALFNLVSNAMKFTDQGGRVRIALDVDEVNAARYAIISVEDSGTGVPPDQIEHIFDRNYKYDRPGVERGREGSGLGLAICREIVHAHGGTVSAESDGKTGSTFYVRLPLYRE